ncbi:MAG TPA: glycosyltransferase [Mycobacteriales bacterium]|nr:glycosyltransferase [Mycobacteriales bacterium]
MLVEGWPDDVRACLDALLRHTSDDVVVQVLDLGDVDGAGAAVEEFAGPRVQAWHVAGAAGWAAARAALLRADTAAVHVWCEVSTVFEGDALGPLLAAFDDPGVVGAGWRGGVFDAEWHEVADAGPGEVDVLLGYLFAMRRSAALATGGPHRKARYYRNADLEFSLALRAASGGRLVVPDLELPVRQGRHHGYHDTDPAYRDRESRRTWLRMRDRYRPPGTR